MSAARAPPPGALPVCPERAPALRGRARRDPGVLSDPGFPDVPALRIYSGATMRERGMPGVMVCVVPNNCNV